MEQPQRTYWFPAKTYGWGWGPPSTWHGWTVLAIYLLSIAAAVRWVNPEANPWAFGGAVFVLSLLFIAICYAKGEPPRWRWGK